MDQASEVREKIDIVSFISEYIPLKKMGRNFTAICPFHNENTPSFVVSPERQIWHCFGCGKGGDVFTFLMEYENLEFIEALRILAKKAGVTLKNTGISYSSSKKEKIYALNKLASEYYSYVLTKHKAGERALEYLVKKRGLNEKLIKTFNIGFSPTKGEDLSKFLINKKKFTSTDLIEAGLSFGKNGKIFDFFRGRIMFPLSDHRGNIVGFSGRNIADNDFGPKYINTRDTLAYHKGSMFFGLDIAKEEIKKEQSAIVMEGEFDVISAFSQGIRNAVALKGTAFTNDQALLISRFASKIALCLDQDSAGMEAVKRSIPALEKRNLQITVVDTGEKDPDEAIKKNPTEFKKAIKADREVYDFLLTKFASEADPKSSIGKKKIGEEMLPLISSIQNEIVKEHYLKKLSETIDTSYESLLRQLEKKEEKTEEKVTDKAKRLDRRPLLEEYLLGLILQSTDVKHHLIKSRDVLSTYRFENPSIGKIFSEILSTLSNREFDLKNISNSLSKELLPQYDKCFLLPLPKFENAIKYEEEVLRVSKELRIIYLKEKIKGIGSELKDKKEDTQDLGKIKEEIGLLSALTRG